MRGETSPIVVAKVSKLEPAALSETNARSLPSQALEAALKSLALGLTTAFGVRTGPNPPTTR